MKIFEKMVKEGLNKVEVKPDSAPFPEAEWIVEIMKKGGHEKVYLISHPEVKLRAVIAIHNRGAFSQTLGGTRMFNYSDEKEAILDALRLSRAMTYKSAMAEVRKGGGKSVIWGDFKKDKTKLLLHKFADEINALQGEYIGGEDMNISEQDVQTIKERTPFIAGLPESFSQGKLRGSGNPAPLTAQGVVYGMKACLRFLNKGSLKDKVVAIQGLGSVGQSLVGFLYQEGVKQIIAADIDPDKVACFQEEFKGKRVKEVGCEEIFSQECDIFAPCARGGILNQETIPLLKCKIVAGAANNQLEDPADGKLLMEKGILYAPDYVINAGGVINVDDELHPDGYDKTRVLKKMEIIPPNLMRIFWYSERLKMPANLVADMLAEEKIWLTQALK